MIYNVPHIISVFARETLRKIQWNFMFVFTTIIISVIMHFHDNCFSSDKTIRVQRWCRTFFLVKKSWRQPVLLLIAYAIAWSCWIVRFEEIPVLRARFLAKFRWRKFSKFSMARKGYPRVFKFSYLRNYCRYFLYTCLIKRMKTTYSENKMKFIKVIQKMRAQLGVSTNLLTVPRKHEKKKHYAFI